ncbi:GGDEF domain-containing protein [Corallococcus terminator]|uniref:GGDEF domain-containing protein n=1 Tax=Corallococcus terminator TaxID=2316733 RepID=A0A3A8IVF0_9BACT|nr:GGDEF domain-containing protein [Corallococcus terminator]RKG83774.1 GGDEF domain-containing protein [Corallococcus terminator]
MDDKTILRNGAALAQRLDGLGDGEDEYVVVFGDLNGFKLVNDRHGHAAGDATIERAGKLLSVTLESFKAEAFRQSGDEFVIVCQKEHVIEVGEALSGTFRSNVFFHKDIKIDIKMSFGWTTIGIDGPKLCLARAEEACRVAKQRGSGTMLEWDNSHSLTTEELRCRCTKCGAAFRLTPSSAHPFNPNHLWCPQCGHQA